MNRRKRGMIWFWLGIAVVFVAQVLNWIQSPIYRVQTAEELRGTAHAISGFLFWVRTLGWSGLALSLIGVLIFTSKKGSYFMALGNHTNDSISLSNILGTIQIHTTTVWNWRGNHTSFKFWHLVVMDPDIPSIRRHRQNRKTGPASGLFICGDNRLFALSIFWIPSGARPSRSSDPQ